jgi:NAD(P)H dehydrogenase (quinone)
MNILIVYAHPEPQSLNGSLNTMMVNKLESLGHSVQVSDLYQMV